MAARAVRHVFFFQAEDGIRDGHVTGVQTCALPISVLRKHAAFVRDGDGFRVRDLGSLNGTYIGKERVDEKIGRASCRERGEMQGGEVWLYNRWSAAQGTLE